MIRSGDIKPSVYTQHALLVAWGAFAKRIGLLQRFQRLSLKQHAYRHTPQAQVLGSLVATLAACPTCKTSAGRPIPWTKTRPWPKPGTRKVGPIIQASAGP